MMLTQRTIASRPCQAAARPLARPVVSRRVAVSCVAAADGAADAAPKRTRKTKVVKEGAIKRAPSAYNLYFKDTFPSLKAKSPGAKAPELTATLSSMWKALPDDKRARFESESGALKAVVAEKRIAAKVEAAKHAKPIQPFAAFVRDNYARVAAKSPGLKAPEVVKAISAEWKAKPTAEREAASAEYKVQVAAWKAKNAPAESA
ncbi:hypothetical protein FOA52_010777 [Chlamydomonas sp. UWO 241]|nr:hypothetical protein FOA52_010777 [Chlamydomonas sp. UWO 241]